MKREEELARRLAGLSEAKRAMLAERLQHSLQQNIPSVSIKKREPDQKMGLSFAQQRLWFLDQLAPGNAFYNMPLTIHLDGLLQVSILFRCLQELIERHESLRTNFVMDGDEPVQVVSEENHFSLPLIDLQEQREEQQELTVQQLSEVEAQRPFDLARDPLIRYTLLRLKPQKHLLLMTMHHIISDGWSMGILYHELTVLYQALGDGLASPLSPLSLQYADYAIFQREWLRGELLQKQLVYWREQLANLTPLDLPLDYPRPPLQTFCGSVLSFTLRADLVQKIQALCQQEGITLFIVLLSAFQMLLARYTGSDDIAVGTPIAGRTEEELEGLVGFFVNTLVIRTDLSGNPLLRDILHSVRHVVKAAFNHQDLPFEKLVEELQPERSLSQSPLIQTLFTLSVPIDHTREIAQLRLHAEEQESQTTQFDLMLTMSEVQDGIVGQFQYNTNLFDLSTIQRLARHFSALLQAIVDTPQQTLWDTPILSYEEQRQILHEWNATSSLAAGAQADCPQEMTIHQCFEQQVERTPDAVALVFEEQHLTYSDLNRQADQLAHHLLEAGIGPDVLVGVCLERSLGLVVAQLSVLKAGGAYVPLDPAYPQERLTFLLSDAQVPVVLTQPHLRDLIGAGAAQGTTVRSAPNHKLQLMIEFIYLQSGSHGTQGSPCPLSQACSESAHKRDHLAPPVQPDNLAYLIYTSGSTGKPKGVMVTHRNVLRLFANTREQFHFHSQDVWTLFHSCAFDFSVWELWGALLHGGRLLIVPYWLSRSPDEFYRLLEASQVTILNQTPSAFRQLIQAEQSYAEDVDLALRLVIFGGEALDLGGLAPWFARHGDESPRLVNMYGITETTVHVTARVLAQTDVQAVGSLIGGPLADLECYVLDRHQQLVPPGVAGELYVGGMGLARGYWQRGDVTAERFVPHPFVGIVPCADPGARLYRTGDVVRYQVRSASLEYLGRVDNQVKLRGFRIELGEIEATLRAHPGVQEAIVMLYEEERVGHYLAAYVVMGQGSDPLPTQAELQSYLREQLPDYMVPTVIVSLQTLPLTLNGKVNRKALPVPERTAHSEEGYVAPQSELEQRLSEIWQQVLGMRTQVGIYENFFDLGGHSLLLIQVRSKLQAYLGYEVPVVDLFQYPTIHALSTYLSGRQEQQALLQPIVERVRKRKGAVSTEELQTSHDGIAIVGLAGRFPGARNIDEFWQNVCNGVESISFFSEEELLASGVAPELIHDKRYVKAHATLDDVESFDAAFFGYSPKEAAMMDPQQRLFLECAWEVLEQAGVIERSGASETYRGPIGVYAGQSASTYLLSNVLANPTFLAENGAFSTLISNDKDFLATRTSYKLNLEGPSMTIQTACSTSLVAVHMACQGLWRYECDMALAGGVSIGVPQKMGYLYEEEGILSPDGHCRAFDAEARGTVAGSGVGIVVLKRLSDALADRDTIYAVIRGSAINNDGAAKVGYTAPSIRGQVKVITEAMAMAGVESESISYVETHGAGTTLGDPIEIAALTQAFRAVGTRTEASPFPTCAIGSLKSNLGHLDAAAGVAGLIKTVLSLKHGMLPPSLHFRHPNPKIDFAKTPFYVNAHLKPWKRGSTPRRAGVSAFGIGGTNAHVILEEAPSPKHVGTGVSLAYHAQHQNEKPLSAPTHHTLPVHTDRPHLVVLSAKTASALETMTERLTTYVKAHPDAHLADMAYTLQMGRKSFPHRRAFVAQERTHMLHLLETRDPESVFTDFVSPETKQVAFLFPGQGTQYVNMGRELYEQEPTFREQIDTCARLLVPHLHYDLREILYPSIGEGQGSLDMRKDGGVQDGGAQDRSLHQTGMTQPALFVVEYALAQLLMKWGIHPQAMIGHSIGEYVAACLAGVLSLEDALVLVALRGRLMQALPVGAMLSVTLAEKDVEEFLGSQVSLAACNGANESVVSGTREAIEMLEKHLVEKGISCHRLHTSHAFHSQVMEPILERFITEVCKIALHPPQIPYISNVTGTWITDQEATNPAYWAHHIRQTVRWASGIQLLLDVPSMVLLEVGPGHALSTLVRRMVDKHKEQSIPQVILSSLRHSQAHVSDRAFLLNTCGRLWCAGVAIDWSQLHADKQRRRISLPTYPFERERYWTLPVGARTGDVRTGQEPVPENGRMQFRKEPDLTQWFSVPSWKLSPLPAMQVLPLLQYPNESSRNTLGTDSLPTPPACKPCWLIFTDTVGLGARLREHLVGKGFTPFQETVVMVSVGTQFCKVGDGEYTIRPESREDYDSLLNDMSSCDLFPTRIIHTWMVIAIDQISSGLDYLETAQTLGFYSLLFLTQALGRQNGEQPQEVAIISNNLQEVIGREVLCPARATALGVGKIAPYEYPHISFRSIDVILPATFGQEQEGKGRRDRGSPLSEPLRVPTDEEQLIEQLIAELRSRSSDLVVAYRGPHRWVRCVEPIQLEKVPEEADGGMPHPYGPLPLGQNHGRLQQGLRQEGVYLITGGLGGTGLVVAEELAREVRARLVLTGRNALPAREEWDRLWDSRGDSLRQTGQAQGTVPTAPVRPTGDTSGEQDAVVSKICQIKRLEELGAEVLVIQADVTDLGQMQNVISQVHQRFGELHGVIHTAGIFDDGLIQMRRPEAAAKVLAPKVRGTLVLEAVLKDVQLDFLVLFSSLAALIGELGRVDYCAANTFLDSFAFYHTAQRRIRTVSINWDGWREVGMSVKDLTSARKALQYQAELQPELQMHLQNGMLSQEGVEALRRIIARGTTSQLIVSTGNILTRLRRADAYLHLEQFSGQAQGTIPAATPQGPTDGGGGQKQEGRGRRDSGSPLPEPLRVPTALHQRPHLQTVYVAPQNEAQQQIADLWQKFLGIEKIGIHDNFVDLGGNSLLATQLITRLRDMFQVDFTLRALFEEPTIARLTMLLVQKKAELIDDALLLQDRGQVRDVGTAARPCPPLRACDRTAFPHFPLSFAQQRLWFLDQLKPGSTAYLIPRAYQLCGLLDIQCFEKSLEGLVRRHESLRTTFVEHAGVGEGLAPALQVIHPVGVGARMGASPVPTVPVIDLQGLKPEQKEEEVRRQAKEEAQRPCDLARGPLLRIYLLRLETEEHVLLLTLHHIITDGWSNEVLVRELSALYQAETAREPSPLPDLPIQYADYALWQRQWLQGEVLDAHIAYWKQQLAGAPTQLSLPTDRSRPTVQTSDGAQLLRLWPLDLQQQLRTLSQREGVTLFITLLSAFYVLLYYYTSQKDLVVGTDVANRDLPETEGLIGFFVNQLVLRTNLSGNPSFLEAMKRVREVSLEAYAHQELPFDYVVKALNPERDLSHTPLFQIKFVLQNETLQDLKATFTVKPLALEPGTSKFDILLDMMESQEGLLLRLEYCTDLFSAETMEQFLHQFEQVIRQMVASPEARLDDIQLLLAAAERDERAKRKQKLRQLDLQKLERVRRERNLNKPLVKRREEIS